MTPIERTRQSRSDGLDRRQFIAAAAGMVLAAPALGHAPGGGESTLPPPEGSGLRARRLTWAGVHLEHDGTTLLVDPITTDIWDGANPAPIVTPEITTRRRFVLITHLHNDHYDKAAIAAALAERGRVVCEREVSSDVASDGFGVRAVDPYEPISLGGFSVVAVPAVDGFGADQVSWVISGGGRRVIHCGDTLWHGRWWQIAKQYGPFDAAFLPINGVRGYWTDPPSRLPGSMTPEQAVAATEILGARQLVPIHYGFNEPGMYEEYPDALPTLAASARERSVRVQTRAPGEWVEWKEGE